MRANKARRPSSPREPRKILGKLITLGNSSVGKTSIIKRYVNNRFDESTRTTIAVDFFEQTVDYCGDRIVLKMWDTAGQELYTSLAPCYFRNSNICLLVYDINCMQSFLNLSRWEKLIQDEGDKVSIILVGNKVDLAEDSRKVSFEQGKEKAQKLGDVPFFEVSAKNGTNISELFDKIYWTIWIGVELEERPPQLESQMVDIDFDTASGRKGENTNGSDNNNNNNNKCATC